MSPAPPRRNRLVGLTLLLILSASPAAGAAEAIRYITWVGGSSKALEDEVVDLFRQRNPDVTVNFETVPGGTNGILEHILLATAGGVQIDLALTHTHWLQSLIEQGLVLDLRPFIERDKIDLKQFPPGVTQSYTGSRGEIYALPFQWTTILLAYNKDYLDRMGMAYPAENWSIFDLYNAAKKLTVSRGNKVETWGFGEQNLDEYVWRLWGVPFLDNSRTRSGWENPKAIEAWAWYGQIYQEGIVQNDWSQWAAGKVGLRLAWPHTLIEVARTVADAWDIALHPVGATGERVSRAAGAQWVILKTSKNPEAAWRLLKFLISEEAQYAFLLRGRGGVHLSAMRRYWVTEFNPAKSGITNPRTLRNRQVMVDAYAYASLEPQPVNYQTLLQEVVRPMASQLRAGKVAAGSAVPEAARQITARLQELTMASAQRR